MIRARMTSLLVGSLLLGTFACANGQNALSSLDGRGNRNNNNNGNFNAFFNQFGPLFDPSIQVEAFAQGNAMETLVAIPQQFANNAALCPGNAQTCVSEAEQIEEFGGGNAQGVFAFSQNEQREDNFRIFTFVTPLIASGTDLTVLEVQGNQFSGFGAFTFTYSSAGGQVQVTPDAAGENTVGTLAGQPAGSQSTNAAAAANALAAANNAAAAGAATGGSAAATPATGGAATVGAAAATSTGAAAGGAAAGGAVTYTASVAPIISQYCLACHGSAGSPDLSSYAAVKAAASNVLSSVTAGTMPESAPLAQAQITTIQQWVSAGEPQ